MACGFMYCAIPGSCAKLPALNPGAPAVVVAVLGAAVDFATVAGSSTGSAAGSAAGVAVAGVDL